MKAGTLRKPLRVLVDDTEVAAGTLEIPVIFGEGMDTDAGARRIGLALRDALAEAVDQLTDTYGGTMNTLEQPITIGRIVLYRHHGSAGGEFPPKDSAAIVTGIVEGDTVSLTVFTSDGGMHPHRAVKHDENLAGGTWRWPPRVGPGPAGPGSPRSAYEASRPPAPRVGD